MGRVENRHGGKKKKEKAPMKLLNKILIILILLLFVAVGGSLAYQFLSKGYITSVIPIINQEQEFFNNGEVNILILGSDARHKEGDDGRSDTLIIAHFNFKEGTARLVSVPRDYYVSIPGYENTKINAAYAYGGIGLTKKTIEKLLDITIDRNIQIDFDTFSKAVDMFGRVEIIMEKSLYDSGWQLDLYEGSNILDGPTALRFVRFRGTPTADLGRMQRQQLFMKSLAHDIKAKANVFEQISIISNLLGGVTTDLSLNEALYMFSAYKKFDDFSITTWTAAGTLDYVEGSGSVVIPDSNIAKMAKGFLEGTLVVADGEEEEVFPSLITLTERAKLNREAAQETAQANSNSTNSATSK